MKAKPCGKTAKRQANEYDAGGIDIGVKATTNESVHRLIPSLLGEMRNFSFGTGMPERAEADDLASIQPADPGDTPPTESTISVVEKQYL